jgi:hypothetical protein
VIPQPFLGLYLTANAIALAILFLAVRRPRIALWISVAIFAWASVTNAQTALGTPTVYLDYADLTLSEAYRAFILGWFSRHIQFMVLSIAAGQATIALLLAAGHPWRRIGVAAAVVFLLAIAPLGVGSGFPFSLTFSAALLVTDRKLATPSPAVRRRTEVRPVA